MMASSSSSAMMMATTNLSSKSTSGPKTVKDKNDDPKPKQPLSAYNIYFQWERKRILEQRPVEEITLQMAQETAIEQKNKPKRRHRKSHGKISFRTLARVVADSWKQLDAASRASLEAQAFLEKQEYLQKVQEWKVRQERKQEQGMINLPTMNTTTTTSTTTVQQQQQSQSKDTTPLVPTSSVTLTATSTPVVSEASSDESSVDDSSSSAPPTPTVSTAVSVLTTAPLGSSSTNSTTNNNNNNNSNKSMMNPLSMPKAAYLDFKGGVGRGTLHIRHPWLQRRTVSSNSLQEEHDHDEGTIITTAPSPLQEQLFSVKSSTTSTSTEEKDSSSAVPMEEDNKKDPQASSFSSAPLKETHSSTANPLTTMDAASLMPADNNFVEQTTSPMDEATEQAVADVVSSMMDDSAAHTASSYSYPGDDLVLQGMDLTMGIDPSLDMKAVFD